MISVDEDALICDLAETYQIYDYRQLPASRVAVFAYGLHEDSRIKSKISGMDVPLDTLLLASISDSLKTLVWFQTEDGQKGRNRPESLVEMLSGKEKQKKRDDIVGFDSGEEFMKARARLIESR